MEVALIIAALQTLNQLVALKIAADNTTAAERAMLIQAIEDNAKLVNEAHLKFIAGGGGHT